GRTCRHAQALALSDSEVVNAGVLADDFPGRRHHFAGSFQRRLALLGKIGIEKLLVIAAWDKTDFLGIRLLGDQQAMLSCQFSHLRLSHSAKWKKSSAKRFLSQSKQKVSLILGGVDRTLQQPTPSLFTNLDPCIVPRRNLLRANLLRDSKKLIKLQVIVTKRTRNWRAPG